MPANGPVNCVVLVLHGGQEESTRPVSRFNVAYLRMLPFARDVHRAAADRGVAVWLLRDRYRGWNRPKLHPVADARWSIDRIREAHGDVPVVLVGHSMGGRVALRVADDASVRAVCALAPWTTPNEPVDQLVGKRLLIAHGDRDRITDPVLSREFAQRAQVAGADASWREITGERHAMLGKPALWTRLVREFVLDGVSS
jgi:pimeloyl-ACP methyl ester carboxylesterase